MVNEKHFRVIFEISANQEDNVFSISDWLNIVLGVEVSNVDHINVTEITELIEKDEFKCPLMED